MPRRMRIRKRRQVRKISRKRSLGRSHRKVSRSHQKLTARPGFGMVRQPFAPNMWTTFTYSETLQLTQSAAGTPSVYQYRANGPYDPRVALGGLQPRYFDTLLGTNDGTAPYSQYRVHAAKIVMTIWPESTSAGAANGIVAIIPERSTVAAASTFAEICERPYCKRVAMTTLGSWKPRKLKHFVKIKTILGHKDLIDIDGAAAPYNNVPSEQVYFNLYTCAIDTTGVLSPRVEINITYFVQLYNLTDVLDS